MHRTSFVVFGFVTTHDALAAESALERQGIDVVPVPAPASVGATCGIAMRVPPDQASQARAVLAAIGVTPSAEIATEDVVRG